MSSGSNRRAAAPRPGRLKLDRAGTSTLEFAVVLPLLMMLIIGIVQYSVFFFTDQSLRILVSYAARSAAIQSQAGTLTTGCPVSSIGSLGAISPALDLSKLTLCVSEWKQANGIVGVTVTGSYPYHLPLPLINGAFKETTTISYLD